MSGLKNENLKLGLKIFFGLLVLLVLIIIFVILAVGGSLAYHVIKQEKALFGTIIIGETVLNQSDDPYIGLKIKEISPDRMSKVIEYISTAELPAEAATWDISGWKNQIISIEEKEIFRSIASVHPNTEQIQLIQTILEENKAWHIYDARISEAGEVIRGEFIIVDDKNNQIISIIRQD